MEVIKLAKKIAWDEDEDIDEEDIKGKITGNGSKILAFTSLTVAMGGDNLGIYALEEHFEKELIENNNRREGE